MLKKTHKVKVEYDAVESITCDICHEQIPSKDKPDNIEFAGAYARRFINLFCVEIDICESCFMALAAKAGKDAKIVKDIMAREYITLDEMKRRM